MRTNKAGIGIIKRFEGLRLRAYLCPANVVTIGYGTTRGVTPDMVITKEQAEELLKRDLTKFENALQRLVNARVTDNQFSALVSFVYNLGLGAFQRSTLRMKVNRGEHEAVREQFLKWNKAAGKVLKGLTLRRMAEADLYELG